VTTSSAKSMQESSGPYHLIDKSFKKRGFLPLEDPVTAFPRDSELVVLDELGANLPSMLEDRGFRQYAKGLEIPPWPESWQLPDQLPLLRLYYLRLGFLASAYVNQTSEDRSTLLPNNIAQPLVHACKLLNRPPILSYDAYALYNWKRFRHDEPIQLGNVDTIQNFVHLYDEHWFIVIHVVIEAIAADILSAISRAYIAVEESDSGDLTVALNIVCKSMWELIKVLRRIPEKMDADLYFKTFRPYIRFFQDVVYQGIDIKPINSRGETGAQSSIMPVLVAFMKIPHQASSLTKHLLDMRNYMPAEHRHLIENIEQMPSIKPFMQESADKDVFNDILDAMATFREVHYHWACEYINRPSKDQIGTGGTPYMQWLKQLIDETRAHKL
jgi:indoleamine 2,3-dioxygenase